MITIEPVTPDRWDDLERLFGASGAYSGCWCTWWRLGSKEWEAAGSAGRRQHLADVVERGDVPGLLAYDDGEPVGWVAVAPRDAYPRLNRSPHTKPVDDVPVWSITCFWIRREHRGRRIATQLLEAAVEHAHRGGAEAIEGYPYDPATRSVTAADAFTGVLGPFFRTGFEELARRTPTSRVVVRRRLGDPGQRDS
ncbi:MAG TPA: GNAT family N-acetyltransferase [Acidimicrobiales bacterium]|nr:GNAT family N-acetyltransferase [Acidimicrobiales bacterium]